MHGVTVAQQKVYKANKRISKLATSCDHVESFKSLWDYANVIKQQMPRPLALLKVTKYNTPADKCRFQRFMMSFLGLRDGFKEGYRPFIGLDGCHLKGPFEGVLLSTVCLDANQCIFPITICVCESENTDSWTSFLDHLQEYLVDDR